MTKQDCYNSCRNTMPGATEQQIRDAAQSLYDWFSGVDDKVRPVHVQPDVPAAVKKAAAKAIKAKA
jgi:hypothetical protein